jgi:hypothetical protein
LRLGPKHGYSAAMKLAGLFACTIPELRKMTLNQLLRVWGGCSPYSQHVIYIHMVLLLACASAIFNAAMRLTDLFFFDMAGLCLGLLLPPNIYFHWLFKDRRPAIRQFIQENRDGFGD